MAEANFTNAHWTTKMQNLFAPGNQIWVFSCPDVMPDAVNVLKFCSSESEAMFAIACNVYNYVVVAANNHAS